MSKMRSLVTSSETPRAINIISNISDTTDCPLANSTQQVWFAKGTRIFREGDAGDGCYLIEAGEVRLEVECPEIDMERVLGYLGPGAFLGELSLFDGQPRSASAYAHTDLTARRMTTTDLEVICAAHPRAGLAMLRTLGRDVAGKVRQSTQRMARSLMSEGPDPEVDALVARAVAAQRAFVAWSEARMDALLLDIAETIAGHAEELAAATVAETGIGNVPDKTLKNRFASLDVYASLAGKVGSGLLHIDAERQVAEIASPVGVVLGLIPLTNPVATIVFKTLICLKGRNALILSCHRNALGVGNRTGEIIQAVLRRHGAPVELVQWVRDRVSRARTQALMRHNDVAFILATGGVSMVKAAYSSGTPAIGVGPGNAPAWICADADLDAAAELVVHSKSFDNGVICGSEQHLVVDGAVRQAFVAALEAQGAAVLSEDEARLFTERAFDPASGKVRRELIGQSAQWIADIMEIKRNRPIRLIVVPVGIDALDGLYGREKLAPILSLFTVRDVEQGLAICQRLLANEGRGHTAIVHTRSQELIERFSAAIAASRILVNAPGAHGCIGLGNGLTPSLTLGCGTFGGTSTTDNVSYTHLLNIKRVVYHTQAQGTSPTTPDWPFIHSNAVTQP